jgi:hypothetical protein
MSTRLSAWSAVTARCWSRRTLRYFIGSNSPTFEFRADQAPKMFTRYARQVENIWKLAEDWHP